MFQYAAARRLAHRHQTSVRIDTSWYETQHEATPRRYELDRLSISGEPASRWETIGTDGVRNARLYELPLALYRKLRPRYQFIGERSVRFNPQVLNLTDNVCLFGYWMSERYFTDIASIIREEFRFRNPPSPANSSRAEQLRSCDSIAVHVRRGDYASNPLVTSIHGLCGTDYYYRAADEIRRHVREPVFFLFSDDLQWASENLDFAGETVVVDDNQGEASPEDLRLMSEARHNIVANSGFSWWGAWLNANPKKIVCAPKQWFADPAYDASDVVPADWIPL